MNNNLKMSVVACFVILLGTFLGSAASATAIPIPVGCIGACGIDTTGNGDVMQQAGFSSYAYITTTGGVIGGGTIPVGALGDETDGSTLTTTMFAATAGSLLQYNFNYVTSDGSGFPDYAWVELESSTGAPVALLFTAATQPSGTIVPGVGLPPPVATLTPPSVPITPGSGTTCNGNGDGGSGCNSPAGGPVWFEIGSWSGDCWAAGCGVTGWIRSDYTITADGTYQLAFGVTNVRDEAYDSGLAIDGLTISGVPIPPIPTSTSEPATLALLGMGLADSYRCSALHCWARRLKLRADQG